MGNANGREQDGMSAETIMRHLVVAFRLPWLEHGFTLKMRVAVADESCDWEGGVAKSGKKRIGFLMPKNEWRESARIDCWLGEPSHMAHASMKFRREHCRRSPRPAIWPGGMLCYGVRYV
jgi:hypothetical protein